MPNVTFLTNVADNGTETEIVFRGLEAQLDVFVLFDVYELICLNSVIRMVKHNYIHYTYLEIVFLTMYERSCRKGPLNYTYKKL